MKGNIQIKELEVYLIPTFDCFAVQNRILEASVTAVESEQTISTRHLFHKQSLGNTQ